MNPKEVLKKAATELGGTPLTPKSTSAGISLAWTFRDDTAASRMIETIKQAGLDFYQKATFRATLVTATIPR